MTQNGGHLDGHPLRVHTLSPSAGVANSRWIHFNGWIIDRQVQNNMIHFKDRPIRRSQNKELGYNFPVFAGWISTHLLHYHDYMSHKQDNWSTDTESTKVKIHGVYLRRGMRFWRAVFVGGVRLFIGNQSVLFRFGRALRLLNLSTRWHTAWLFTWRGQSLPQNWQTKNTAAASGQRCANVADVGTALTRRWLMNHACLDVVGQGHGQAEQIQLSV